MKKAIELAFFVSAVYFLSGCKQLETVSDKIYDPVTATNTVETPEGPVQVVSTNGYVVSPKVASTVSLIGDFTPAPYGGLVANSVLALLGIFAHIKGKKWKGAAVSAVSAAQEFKEQLSKLDQSIAQEVKSKVRVEQKLAGTQPMIQQALNLLGK